MFPKISHGPSSGSPEPQQQPLLRDTPVRQLGLGGPRPIPSRAAPHENAGPLRAPAPESVTPKAPETSAGAQGEAQGPSGHRHPVGRALCFMGTLLLLLLSRFSRVRLCATPYTAAHQAPPSLGFSRQEHWSGLPFPSPMHESEK